ncbi:hypothetical protein OXYTRIMIC_268 [Oxytricha trifallax]|uniref:Uncharacterized protein n=1 Tax=Oxytricha trifallax TaxID=1172189 RepID=A0A073I0G4_9SPIT|nr:hypothetical protein OXYTRIMIC_268 [Oxytricha trifallax]
MTWNILDMEGFSLHIFTVYIRTYQNEEVKELQNRLIQDKIIKTEVLKLKNCSDERRFLKKRVRRVDFIRSRNSYIRKSIRPNFLERKNGLTKINRPKANLSITENKISRKELKVKRQKQCYRISDIRKQGWKTFIEEEKRLTEKDLDNPIIKCFEEKLERHRKIKHWYNQPTDQAIRNNKTGLNNQYEERKTQWNDAIQDKEQSQERNDLQGFFYLVKRQTKSKKYQRPTIANTNLFQNFYIKLQLQYCQKSDSQVFSVRIFYYFWGLGLQLMQSKMWLKELLMKQNFNDININQIKIRLQRNSRKTDVQNSYFLGQYTPFLASNKSICNQKLQLKSNIQIINGERVNQGKEVQRKITQFQNILYQDERQKKGEKPQVREQLMTNLEIQISIETKTTLKRAPNNLIFTMPQALTGLMEKFYQSRKLFENKYAKRLYYS